jgi:D-serine deaminase-like pyridoxal phosphate-dependent protein
MPDPIEDLPTPCIVIDAATVRRNLARVASYAREHGLGVRPHTKTHKSTLLARMQMEQGAVGLTVAKVGEASIMAGVTDNLLMAYPAVDRRRCAELASLARGRTVRIGIDSIAAADCLNAAAVAAGVIIGILIDLDVGHHRTGVQSPQESLELGQHVENTRGLRLDGVMFFPGQISSPPAEQAPALKTVSSLLESIVAAWRKSGLEANIVSGGSTPTLFQSHLIPQLTEIRPGTYVYNDMNSVRGGCATLDDCAARIIATVVSTAVPGQVVLDAGSKTLTSDRCGPAPDSGHGYVLEYPNAKIVKLSEEHAQVDVTACDRRPKVGERVTVIPNHICPCINLQDAVYWKEPGEPAREMKVDARGKVF